MDRLFEALAAGMTPENAAASLLEPSRWDRNTFGPARDLQTAYKQFLKGDLSVGELYYLANDVASGADAMGDLAARISQEYGKAATADEVPESAVEPAEPDEVPVVIESIFEAMAEQMTPEQVRAYRHHIAQLYPAMPPERRERAVRAMAAQPGAAAGGVPGRPGRGDFGTAAPAGAVPPRAEAGFGAGAEATQILPTEDPERTLYMMRLRQLWPDLSTEELKAAVAQRFRGTPTEPEMPAVAPPAPSAVQAPTPPPTPTEPAAVQLGDPKRLIHHGVQSIHALRAIADNWQKGQWWETFGALRGLHQNLQQLKGQLDRVAADAKQLVVQGRGDEPFQVGIAESLDILEQAEPITLPILTKKHLNVLEMVRKFLGDLRRGTLTNRNVADSGSYISDMLAPWLQRGSPIGQSMVIARQTQQTVPRGAVQALGAVPEDPLARAERALAAEQPAPSPAAAAPERPAEPAYATPAEPEAPEVADAIAFLQKFGQPEGAARRAVMAANPQPGEDPGELARRAFRSLAGPVRSW